MEKEIKELKEDISLSIRKVRYLTGEIKKIYELWIKRKQEKLKELENKTIIK